MEKEAMNIQARRTRSRVGPRPIRWTSTVLAAALVASGALAPAAHAANPTNATNANQTANPSLRPVEYLTRGLVAAQVPGGIFLSWRFLGDEPDGLSWNVYRKDGDAEFM